MPVSSGGLDLPAHVHVDDPIAARVARPRLRSELLHDAMKRRDHHVADGVAVTAQVIESATRSHAGVTAGQPGLAGADDTLRKRV